MFRKLTSVLSICLIVLVSNHLLFAQSKKDWKAVKSLVNQEVAVKSKSGMKYGIVISVDSNTLILKIANKKSLTDNEQKFNRNEVKKVWRAVLFINQRNTAKGALIGAGVGAVALGVPSVAEDRNDPLAGAGFLLGGLGGAAVGGVVGFFSKKKHKKRDLVYKK